MATPTIDKVVKGNLVMHDHSEADLGAVLDSRYVNTTGDTMTGDLDMSTADIVLNNVSLVGDTADALVINKTSDSIRANLDVSQVVASDKTFTFPNATGTLALTSDIVSYIPVVNTEAVILATTPTSGLIAYGTDTQFFYIADGTNWRRASLKFYTDSANPDMGYLQNNSKDGYYATFITDKYLYNVILQGYNGTAVNGAIRINTSATPDTLEIYMRGAGWYTIVYDLSMSLGYFVHYPFSTTQAVKVWDGMSNEIGLNGRPIINEYTASMGAYPLARLLYGGSF